MKPMITIKPMEPALRNSFACSICGELRDYHITVGLHLVGICKRCVKALMPI